MRRETELTQRSSQYQPGRLGFRRRERDGGEILHKHQGASESKDNVVTRLDRLDKGGRLDGRVEAFEI